MIHYVLGKSGTGKTKYLVEKVEKEVDKDTANVVFITSDDDKIRILDHNIRLINAKSYKINCVSSLKGFIAGILARDFDIAKVYVDGIYKLVDLNEENIEKLTKELKELSEYAKADIYLGLDWSKEELPSSVDVEFTELSNN